MSVNPVCVAALAHRGWAISIECDQSPDAPASYTYITLREGLTAEKSGFVSQGDALNAAMAWVDVESLETQKALLDDSLIA